MLQSTSTPASQSPSQSLRYDGRKLKAKPFEQYEQGELIIVMGTVLKVQTVSSKTVEGDLPQKEEAQPTSKRSARPYSTNVIFKALFDDSEFRHYSEYFCWLFLMYRCNELIRWLKLKYFNVPTCSCRCVPASGSSRKSTEYTKS